MANRYFVFFQLKGVRKPWWNHKPLPFVFTKHFFPAIESFYRPLVISNLSFIFTETLRWQIFYTVNYRRKLIKMNFQYQMYIIIRQADCFKTFAFFPSLIECKWTTFFRCLAIYGVFSSWIYSSLRKNDSTRHSSQFLNRYIS